MAKQTAAPDNNPLGALNAGTLKLLDRMTGRLGTHPEIEVRSRMLQSAVGPALASALQGATGLDIDVRPSEIRSGPRRELLTALSEGSAYCSGMIREWSSDLCYLCDTAIVVALVECLLGGADPDEMSISRRPLSGIELDMSLVIFEQFNDALKVSVTADQKTRTSVSRPETNIPSEEDDPLDDFHAAAIGFDLEFGPVTARLFVLVRQSVLLKTRSVNRPDPEKEVPRSQQEWSERLSARVARSEVRLEAQIGLSPMTLGDISRLRPGDLIAFAGEGDTKVTLTANGKELYSCALGRSGQRYMVRVEGPAGADENWRKELG